MSLTYTDVGTVVPLHPLEVSGQVFVAAYDPGSSGTDVPFEIYANYGDLQDSINAVPKYSSSRMFRMRVKVYNNGTVENPSGIAIAGQAYATCDMGIDYRGRYAFWTAPGVTATHPHEKAIIQQLYTGFVGIGTTSPTQQLTVVNIDTDPESQVGDGGGVIMVADGIAQNPKIRFQSHYQLADDSDVTLVPFGGRGDRKDWEIGVNSAGAFYMSMKTNEGSPVNALVITEEAMALSGGSLNPGTAFQIGENGGGLHITNSSNAHRNYSQLGCTGTNDLTAASIAAPGPYFAAYNSDYTREARLRNCAEISSDHRIFFSYKRGRKSVIEPDGRLGLCALSALEGVGLQVGRSVASVYLSSGIPRTSEDDLTNIADTQLGNFILPNSKPILVYLRDGVGPTDFVYAPSLGFSQMVNNPNVVPGVVLTAVGQNNINVTGSIDLFQYQDVATEPASGLALSVAGKMDGQTPSNPERITIAYAYVKKLGDGTNSRHFFVDGTIEKQNGTFLIPHPILESHNLRHSFIEGPKADLIYRGKISLVGGRAEVDIDAVSRMTKGTFRALCRDIQCFVTNSDSFDRVRGYVTDNVLHIECENGDSRDTVSWMVIGERKDEKHVASSITDDHGNLIVQELKNKK